MFMATKTLTIIEDAYNLLKENKLKEESFSEEIRRLFSRKSKRSLKDFFGILNDNAEAMQKDLAKIRNEQIKLMEKIKL
ncbi:hypothetical protein COV16_05915 [Candidatus Woesearchaeota archaeon CG10_big_fil_rev_8_21_14_0_10_34_8]|nr:MAG: hypothetical protein COV16_05915 [Candidatus Woesearchaeota archaeon CG10_big_fil_rev_8_21_14_0_10_34_8]